MLPPRSRPGRSGLEVADIFRGEAASFLRAHGHRLSSLDKRALADIQACRTAAMGGHLRACDQCDHQEISYNSCRNRHCPKCQAMARAAWLDQRAAELLPISYFHVVFTLPAPIAALALHNKRLLYGILFEAASQTLREVAANPRHLGAHAIGILCVLHTWGQNLMHHPHLHCVVSGGGLSRDQSRWIASRADYFLPVRVLSRVFRRKYCELLGRAFNRGLVRFYGDLQPLSSPAEFRRFLQAAIRPEWVVYAKRPFGGPQQVLKYLARYTHRVAISNSRLVSYRAGQVTFRYKDYARQGRQRTMTLAASEFMRRFLLHVLPSGFMRIRHYGYLANRHRRQKLAICRQLLGVVAEPHGSRESADVALRAQENDREVAIRCSVCQAGRMQIVDTFDRLPRHGHVRQRPPPYVPIEDTS